MRITAEAKAETGAAIRKAAKRLFAERGLEGTSTRDLAQASQIAAGTLFNYFPSKEALALTLVAEAIQEARTAPQDGTSDTPLEACLFDAIARITWALAPMRAYLGQVLEAGLSPLAAGALSPEAQRIRSTHLEEVVSILNRYGLASAATPASLHLYWALFLAILAFWASDESPTQEDTRALIDQTVRMFSASLRPAHRTEGAP